MRTLTVTQRHSRTKGYSPKMAKTRRVALTALRRAQGAMTLGGETGRIKMLRSEIEQTNLLEDSWKSVGGSLSRSLGTIEPEVTRARHRANS